MPSPTRPTVPSATRPTVPSATRPTVLSPTRPTVLSPTHPTVLSPTRPTVLSPTRPTGHPPRARRTRRLVALAGLVAVVVLAAGCGGDSGATAATDTTEAPLPTEQVVRIVDHDLVEGDIEVPVGGTVRWENQDPVDHQLVSLGTDVIRSPVLGKAATYSVQFTAPGDYPYYCSIHNYMKGTVVVR